MTEAEFRRALGTVVDTHIRNLISTYSQMNANSTAIMRIARQDGVPDDLIREAIETESVRVDQALDAMVRRFTGAPVAQPVH